MTTPLDTGKMPDFKQIAIAYFDGYSMWYTNLSFRVQEAIESILEKVYKMGETELTKLREENEKQMNLINEQSGYRKFLEREVENLKSRISELEKEKQTLKVQALDYLARVPNSPCEG